MLSQTMLAALNNQVKLEAASSHEYLAMGSWCDIQPGFSNIAEYFFSQSDEERVHMLKLIRFINERGGFAVIPPLDQPVVTQKGLKSMFEQFLKHEIAVSESINELVDLALREKDYATHNFLQWYVNEQIEEERSARVLNDKLELIGEDKSGLYLFDRDILMTRQGGRK